MAPKNTNDISSEELDRLDDRYVKKSNVPVVLGSIISVLLSFVIYVFTTNSSQQTEIELIKAKIVVLEENDRAILAAQKESYKDIKDILDGSTNTARNVESLLKEYKQNRR